MQMKQELERIYHDLSNGKLSQKEALDRIKAIKLRSQERTMGVLLVVPFWQARSVETPAEVSKLAYTEHHVILCGLSKVNAGKPRSPAPRACLPA